MAGVIHVKAQQATLSNNLLYKTYSIKPDTNNQPRVKVSQIQIVSVPTTDHMPIVKTSGNSKMPVVQTDATAYTMPVAGMNLPRIYTMKKKEPALTAPVK